MPSRSILLVLVALTLGGCAASDPYYESPRYVGGVYYEPRPSYYVNGYRYDGYYAPAPRYYRPPPIRRYDDRVRHDHYPPPPSQRPPMPPRPPTAPAWRPHDRPQPGVGIPRPYQPPRDLRSSGRQEQWRADQRQQFRPDQRRDERRNQFQSDPRQRGMPLSGPRGDDRRRRD